MYIECLVVGEGKGVGNEIETKNRCIYKTKLHFGKAMRIARLLIGEGGGGQDFTRLINMMTAYS